jgi:hypothetical protein
MALRDNEIPPISQKKSFPALSIPSIIGDFFSGATRGFFSNATVQPGPRPSVQFGPFFFNFPPSSPFGPRQIFFSELMQIFLRADFISRAHIEGDFPAPASPL